MGQAASGVASRASGAASLGRRGASAVLGAPGALTSRFTGTSKPRQGHGQVQGQGSSAPQSVQQHNAQEDKKPKGMFARLTGRGGGKKTRRNRRNRRQRGGSGRKGPCVASNASNL